MNRHKCLRCAHIFFSPELEEVLSCPVCGFASKVMSPDRRDMGRQIVQKFCDIYNGEAAIPVKTVDVSDNGLGIKVLGDLPFKLHEEVNVDAMELKLRKKARIVWMQSSYGLSRAGLQFC